MKKLCTMRWLSRKIWAGSNSMRAHESKQELPRTHKRSRPNKSFKSYIVQGSEHLSSHVLVWPGLHFEFTATCTINYIGKAWEVKKYVLILLSVSMWLEPQVVVRFCSIVLFLLICFSACVNSVRWSCGGKYLATGGDDKLIMIWQMAR